MVATATTHDAILKVLVPESKLVRKIEEADPFIGLVKKRTDFGGKYIQVPCRSVNNQAASATFATGQALTSGASNVEFDVTRVKYYAFAFLDNELIEAAKVKKAAFVDAVTDETDSTMETLQGILGAQVYGNGGGALGQISTVATTRITLTDPRDIVNFHVGMTLQVASTDGTSGSVETGSHVISAIDPVNGYLDAATNWSTGIATIAANQYLFRAGDFGAAMAGMGGWCPASAPTSGDDWFGVDRSSNPERLAGMRITSTATSVEDAIQDALGEAQARKVGKMTHGFMNARRWHELAKEMGSRVVRDDSVESKQAGIGYEALVVVGPQGVIRLLPSIYCPYDTAFFTSPEDWTLHGLGTVPSLFKYAHGHYLNPVYNADQHEMRFGWKGNLWTPYPHRIVRLTFA